MLSCVASTSMSNGFVIKSNSDLCWRKSANRSVNCTITKSIDTMYWYGEERHGKCVKSLLSRCRFSSFNLLQKAWTLAIISKIIFPFPWSSVFSRLRWFVMSARNPTSETNSGFIHWHSRFLLSKNSAIAFLRASTRSKTLPRLSHRTSV